MRLVAGGLPGPLWPHSHSLYPDMAIVWPGAHTALSPYNVLSAHHTTYITAKIRLSGPLLFGTDLHLVCLILCCACGLLKNEPPGAEVRASPSYDVALRL